MPEQGRASFPIPGGHGDVDAGSHLQSAPPDQEGFHDGLDHPGRKQTQAFLISDIGKDEDARIATQTGCGVNPSGQRC